MIARTSMGTFLTRIGTTTALTAATVSGPLLVPGAAPGAEAATAASKALRIAASMAGAPYRYGAEGPYSFDCSGLTVYSYKKAGKQLPRTADAQHNSTPQVPASSRKRGDLVFFHSGPTVYHVGIYAGHDRIWHSPRPGRSVRLEKIWTDGVSYGRVR